MAGFLPTTRPVSSNYGADFEDEHPVENPELELSAAGFNKLKGDVAYMAGVTPLAVVYVTNSGTPSVTSAFGIEIADITVTDLGTGLTQLDFAGLTINHAVPTPYSAVAARANCGVFTVGGNAIAVRTVNASDADTDMNFSVVIY